MESAEALTDENFEQTVLTNISKWQALDGALAPLTKEQLDVIYAIEDVVQAKFYSAPEKETVKDDSSAKNKIDTLEDYVKWMVTLENEMNSNDASDYLVLADSLAKQSLETTQLFDDSEAISDTFKDLLDKYQRVTTKTDFLHYLHEELMDSKKHLESKQQDIHSRLKYFKKYHSLQNTLITTPTNINDRKYTAMLEEIDEAIEYLEKHLYFKESPYYKANYENLLSRHLLIVLKHFMTSIETVVAEMRYHDNKTNLLEIDSRVSAEPNANTAFSFYYGKFQNAASKLNNILQYIENRAETSTIYKKILNDCEKTYFTERSSIISSAVTKSLTELKNKHIHEQSILFRLSLLFIAKVCQDEIACYHYFFVKHSPQLNSYLSVLCQNLYEILRSSLIAVKHLEVLTELCTIIKEILLNLSQNDDAFDPLLETIKQLLQDVQERIVYRSNVFFQHDLAAYSPSTGDLAYPEKLEQLETIYKDDPNSSLTDLHSMWYPTVKRCLVCISRLYICLDRQTFQSLAQEALMVCAKSLDDAANKISASKSKLHGKLFQIKHLLIIREQIAPFQADFTVKEMSIDFGTFRTAAVDLIHNKDKIFSLNNNAFLEFLLKGTPRVKEYFVDSRKEIDKQLKLSCEQFIAHSTQSMVGNLLTWLQNFDGVTQFSDTNPLRNLEYGKPSFIAELITVAQKNIKSYIPHLQKYMKLYLANRDTEFILFRPIKNNVINAFIEVQQLLTNAKFTPEELAIVACPTSEQLNVLIFSVSLNTEEELHRSHSRQSSVTS